jgi:hypothetical protein
MGGLVGLPTGLSVVGESVVGAGVGFSVVGSAVVGAGVGSGVVGFSVGLGVVGAGVGSGVGFGVLQEYCGGQLFVAAMAESGHPWPISFKHSL